MSTHSTPAIIHTIDTWIYEKTEQQLSDVQQLIVQACWHPSKKTYEEIAAEHNYSANYLEKRVAPSLWRLLSAAAGQRVTKSNCKTVLSKHLIDYFPQTLPEAPSAEQSENRLENRPGTTPTLPKAQVKQAASDAVGDLSQPVSEAPIVLEHSVNNLPVDSPFYIALPEEVQCCQIMLRPGALLRIKAPRKMGKTLLMNRAIAHARESGCVSVCLNFQQADQAILADLNKLLRWVCATLTQQLNLPLALDDFWSEDIGSKMSCTLYFQGYIFPTLEAPLILALEEASVLFDYPQVAQDFFAMVRTWHEYTKSDDAWYPLRLILVQSTEAYIPLDINRSPFNVGVEVAIKPLTLAQMTELAGRYWLTLGDDAIAQLMNLVAGHPYLVQLAFSHLVAAPATFEDLLASAVTDVGIFSDHLHRHLWTLQHAPELEAAFQQVLASPEAIQLPQVQSFKLNSMGLVTLVGNQSQVSCQLYQQYFSQRLS